MLQKQGIIDLENSRNRPFAGSVSFCDDLQCQFPEVFWIYVCGILYNAGVHQNLYFYIVPAHWVKY